MSNKDTTLIHRKRTLGYALGIGSAVTTADNKWCARDSNSGKGVESIH